MEGEKYTILIVDDLENNRLMLKEILSQEYHIIEAESGAKALDILNARNKEIDLVLLEEQMPQVDGFDVLTVMNNKSWIETIPVIMISGGNSQYSMRRAYGLGASDYISIPFDSVVVRRRVINTLLLYSKQKKLVAMLVKQIHQREKNANLMANILGHIVEFRNGKSGSHVLNVGVITRILLNALNKKSNKYKFTYNEISLIGEAATLHDIGKITIPEEIVYKTSKLTDEEFEVMKSHSVAGAAILEEMKDYYNEPLIRLAHDICKWHHERYDGKGYPEGLVGDEIPIEAQVVGLADVYDVLTSERVYKDAMLHDEAVAMILNGECGAFNCEILECFKEEADNIFKELKLNPLKRNIDKEITRGMKEFFGQDEMVVIDKILENL